MAIVLTDLGDDQYAFELSHPELAWLRLVSDRCCWDAATSLSFAISKGLANLVEVTGQVQTEFKEWQGEEVTG